MHVHWTFPWTSTIRIIRTTWRHHSDNCQCTWIMPYLCISRAFVTEMVWNMLFRSNYTFWFLKSTLHSCWVTIVRPHLIFLIEAQSNTCCDLLSWDISLKMEFHLHHSDAVHSSVYTHVLFNAVNIIAPLYHNGDHNLQNTLLILSIYLWQVWRTNNADIMCDMCCNYGYLISWIQTFRNITKLILWGKMVSHMKVDISPPEYNNSLISLKLSVVANMM